MSAAVAIEMVPLGAAAGGGAAAVPASPPALRIRIPVRRRWPLATQEQYEGMLALVRHLLNQIDRMPAGPERLPAILDLVTRLIRQPVLLAHAAAFRGVVCQKMQAIRGELLATPWLYDDDDWADFCRLEDDFAELMSELHGHPWWRE